MALRAYKEGLTKLNYLFLVVSLILPKAICYCKAGLDVYKLSYVVLNLVCGMRND